MISTNCRTGFIVGLLLVLVSQQAAAQPLPWLNDDLNEILTGEPQSVVLSLQLLLLLTVLSLAPAILILTTSFTRIVIVLSFVRGGLSTQQIPPNQIVLGLALFLTFFVMAPYWSQVNAQAVQPYLAGDMAPELALKAAQEPIRTFMFRQTSENDLALFVHMADIARPDGPEDVPTHILVPAFVISELKTAFQIGFLIYIPFLVIDMVVASTLMSMGMLMLPPVMISLPFKLLLFVMVDGWNLVVHSVLQSFS